MKEYYTRNRERILAARRERYALDPDYREAQRERAKLQRLNRAIRALNRACGEEPQPGEVPEGPEPPGPTQTQAA